jgi:hypothetical protein
MKLTPSVKELLTLEETPQYAVLVADGTMIRYIILGGELHSLICGGQNRFTRARLRAHEDWLHHRN